MKVLLVEDEQRLASTLAKGLRAEGFVVVTAFNGVDGLWQAVENDFDVIVLDIMLPGLSGYEVLRRMRAQDVWTPVLMLTAKDGEYDQTDAFDLGADDYLTKPFSFIVLVARLRALVRAVGAATPRCLDRGLVCRWTRPPGGRARLGARSRLTPREYGLLEYLMRNKDTVVTKTEILQNVWDAHYDGPDNVVEVYVGYVRRKIDIPFGTNTIQTVRGVGYRLESGRTPSATERLITRAAAGPVVDRDGAAVCAATISRTIARPSPVPPPLRERSASSRTKRSKTRDHGRPAGMPGPSSPTPTTAQPSAGLHVDLDARRGVPGGVVEQVAQHPGQRVGVAGEPGRGDVGAHLERGLAAQPLRTSAEARSSRSTSSLATVRPRSSARASSSRSSMSAFIRCASGISVPAASSAASSSGCATATSSAEMIVVSGLRSSCDASPTKRCCAAWPASIRASISFMVTASAAISSRLSGTGTRSVRSDALMSATLERISSTDLIERRTRKVSGGGGYRDDEGRGQCQRHHHGAHRGRDRRAALADQDGVAAVGPVQTERAEPDPAERRSLLGHSDVQSVADLGERNERDVRRRGRPAHDHAVRPDDLDGEDALIGLQQCRFDARGPGDLHGVGDVTHPSGCGAVHSGQHGPVEHGGKAGAREGEHDEHDAGRDEGRAGRYAPSRRRVLSP